MTASPDILCSAEAIEDLVPVALVRLVSGVDGYQLVQANERAVTLLATPVGDLLGSGFVAGFFEDDALRLTEALEHPDHEPSKPIVLRWGSSPPVSFVTLDCRRNADGSFLCSLQDVSDQYRLDAILSGHNSWNVVFDEDGFVQWISPGSAKMLGAEREVYLGRHVTDILHPDNVPDLVRAIQEMQANPGAEVVRTYQMCHLDNPQTYWTCRTASMYLPDEPAIGGTICRTDIALDSSVEPAPQSNEAIEMTLAEMMPSGLLVAGNGRIHLSNGLARRMLGTAVEGDAYRWIERLREEHQKSVRAAMMTAETDAARTTTTAALDRSDGSTLWLRIEAMPAFDARGRLIGYATTLLDVTAEVLARQEMERSGRQLWELANHDALTGLPNRMQFRDRLDRALARTRREGRSTALLFCDLDHFKKVNDELGHAAGDAVLIEIGRRLRSCTRETDTVSRLGGDEFVVISEGFDDLAGVETLARRLIAMISQPIQLGLTTARVGLSVGLAVATAESTTDQLLARADAAVYTAKQAGRSNFVIAD